MNTEARSTDWSTSYSRVSRARASRRSANCAWFREVTIPATATRMDFQVSAHDRENADAFYRVRVVSGGTPTVLRDWTLKEGVEGSLQLDPESVDVSAFAGQTVTLIFEQDGNPPGSNEQIYIDNVWIR